MQKFSQPKIVPEFTGLQINTSVQVLPVPIIYGSPRVAINMIYYNGFNVQQVSTSSGGKGILGGGKGGSKEVEYFATIILAIGEGQLSDILVIYQDQGVYTTSDYPSPGLNYFPGTSSQTPWSYVQSNWPSDARGYKDTAYLAVANATLDSSATVPQINLVLKGIYHATCPLFNTTITITSGQYDQNGNPISFLGNITLGDADADPALVVYDFLTNPTYGAGFPAAFIDSAAGASLFSGPNATNPAIGDAAMQTYAQAVGFGWSVVLNNVQSANSILDQWTKNIGVAPVWTGELLKFIPYWDTPNGANPGYDPGNPLGIPQRYFTPNTTPIVEISIDHILQSKEKEADPISFSRVDPWEVYNTVRVDFRDRYNFFNDNVVEAKDEAQVELFGPRVDNIGLATEFTLSNYANASAQVQLRRNISIRRNFTFRLGPLWAFLDPMDIVQIPDPTDWTKNVNVRIVSCEDDEDEITTYKAEEFPLGAGSPTFIEVSPTTPPNQGPTNVPASPVFPPVIFEPTSAMLTGTGFSIEQIIIGASGGTNDLFDSNWGGCIIWVSLDDVNYSNIGFLKGPSAIGTLTATLGNYIGSNPDNTNTLSVSMNKSDIALPNYGTISNAASLGASLCIVKDLSSFELLTYETSTLTGTNQFNLTGLYRGKYGTTARQFNAGSQFLFMGVPTFFETALPAQYVGSTFWIKLQSYNVFGGTMQDLSTCVAYQYTTTGPTPATPHLPQFSSRRGRRLVMPVNRPTNRRRLL